jgi:hypothetical protein
MSKTLTGGIFHESVRGECFTNPVSEMYRTMNTLKTFSSSSFDTFCLVSLVKTLRTNGIKVSTGTYNLNYRTGVSLCRKF